jgi:hypothetical protein
MPKKKQPSMPLPAPEPPKRHKRGRIKGAAKFEPTPEMRQTVRIAVACAIPQEQIALLVKHPATGLPIGETSLKTYFPRELEDGAAEIRMTHGMSLLKQVREGNVTAIIWWDKTRNKIGAGLTGRDHGEDKPTAPPIEAETTDIVVIARRVAFTLAMGKAKMARAETTAIKPAKATSTTK